MTLRIRALLPLLLLVTACGGGAPASLERPIVVIGFDSADWTWIDPAIEAGRMPHLAGLQARGVRAELLSLVPPDKSPTIWTSIATGKRPVKHGVAGFIQQEGAVTQSGSRTATTYWEILGATGKSQAVIGWWVTYPATPVNGVLVSDTIQYYAGGKPLTDDTTFPPDLHTQVGEWRVDPESIPLADLDRFIDVEVAETYGDAADDLLRELRWIYAGDETFRRVARELHLAGPYDVFTVYFRGVDAVSHAYWQYFQPESGVRVEGWQVDMLGELIPRYYDYMDELLGEILGYIPEDARVVVLSDHGFAGLRRTARGIARGVEMHDDHGILVLAGPGIAEGERLDEAGVKDIAPTLLAMAGLPPAQDMDGHLLSGAFRSAEQRWFESLVTQSVRTYEGIVPLPKQAAAGDAEVDEEMLERLRALGYIE